MSDYSLRTYLCEGVNIDGRKIPYTVVTSSDYFVMHDGIDPEKVSEFEETHPEITSLVTQIIALKQSCFLLRHTTHSCQSLSDGLYQLKLRLIKELKDSHEYSFDDAWMESLVPETYDDLCWKNRHGYDSII